MTKTNHPIGRPRDKTLDEVLAIVEKLTAKQISEKSGNLIGANTIYNWRNDKVKRPQHYTMEAALHAAGFRFNIIREYNGKANSGGKRR